MRPSSEVLRLRTFLTRVSVLTAVLLALCITSSIGAIDDHVAHPPPTTGPYGYYPTYGTFGPDQPGFLGVAEAYVDPVFGSSIQRLSNLYPNVGPSQLYVKNGYWNADGTRFLTDDSNSVFVIDSSSGDVVYTNVPGGVDSQFDPVDPDLLYYFSGTELRQIDITTGSDTLVKSFSAQLRSLGGSVDWIDVSGRYFVLSIGPDSFRIYDRENDLLYDGSIDGSLGPGWIGISPDAQYLITAGPAFGDWHSYRIDHAMGAIDTVGVHFWTLCGDHGDIVSASDGKTYVVTFECYDEPAMYAVDVTIPQTGDTSAGRQKQREDNRKLIDISWNDTGHISGVSRGSMQDWAVISLYDGVDDQFTSGVEDWLPFKDEILIVNVLTGELNRLAHHRSRVPLLYCRSPRACVSWDGSKIMFASNYGFDGGGVDGCGYSDIYVLEPGAGDGIPCADVLNLQARCVANSSGNRIITRIRVTDESHNGESLAISVDGVASEVTVKGSRAVLVVRQAGAGSHTVELTDPASCLTPVVVECP